jgi:drug/metabolite transporter (DMT)-like permease
MDSHSAKAASFDYISYLGLALLALCFGSAFYFTSLALTGFSVAGTGAGRIIVAALFLVPLSLMTGHGLPGSRAGWLWSAGLGIVAWVVPFILLVWAQTRIPTNILGAFFAAVPLMILFLSWMFLSTPVSVRKWMGLVVGSVGLILLAGPGTLSQLGNQSEYMAQIAVFLATIGFAAGAIIIRVMPSPSAIQAAAGASLASALLVSPVLYFELSGRAISSTAVMGVLGVGVVSTGIGQFLRFFLIRRRGPIFIVPNGYLTAIITAVLGALLLGETLTFSVLISFAVILAGLFIASDGSGFMKQV